MTDYPKISIITPSYNQGRYIEETILSVLNQDYPALEYIIIDGGSTDNTIDIIKKYESRLTYWVSEKDKGQTDAINKGFKLCTGEIFNWLNSDDLLEQGALFSIAETFNNKRDTLVVCGKETGFYNNSNDTVNHPGSIIMPTLEETIFIGIIDQPCTYFKTEAIKNFFPLTDSLKYVMDRELWWCYLFKYGLNNIISIDKKLTRFRLHQQSKSIEKGYLFEDEFNKIRAAYLKQKSAPKWLIDFYIQEEIHDFNFIQISNNSKIINDKKLLSLFANEYALKMYVKGDHHKARNALFYIKEFLSKEHLNQLLYFKLVMLPSVLLRGAKLISRITK